MLNDRPAARNGRVKENAGSAPMLNDRLAARNGRVVEASQKDSVVEMDYLKGLGGHRVVGEGQQESGTENFSGDGEEEKPLEFSDHKRTVNYLGPTSNSGSSKKTEASSGRERIRIIFKRKAPGEEHAVNVVVGPASKKQTVSGSGKVLTQSPSKHSGGPNQEVKAGQILGVAPGNRQREKQVSQPSLQPVGADTVSAKNSLLLKKPKLESECHLFGVGLTFEANEDNHFGAASRSSGQDSSVLAPSGIRAGIKKTSAHAEFVHDSGEHLDGGLGIACLDKVSSVSAGLDSPVNPASSAQKECYSDDQGAASERDAVTQGSSVNVDSSHDDETDIRPKARRTPLAFPSSGVHAVDGEVQVTVCSSISGSPNGSSVPLPAKRSPLPLPAVRLPLPLPSQNQVSSAESSVDVSVLHPNLPDEGAENMEKPSSLQSGLQSLSSSHSTSTGLELASTVSGLQKLENEPDVQSIARDSNAWMTLRCMAEVTKQDFGPLNHLRSTGDDENVNSAGNEVEETNRFHDENDSAQVAQGVSLPEAVRSQCTAHLLPGQGPTVQLSDLPSSIGAGTGQPRFSFQRLINGDMSDVEDDEEEEADDEYEEGVDEEEEEEEEEELEEKEEEEEEEEVSEVYSAEWNLSEQPPEQMHNPDLDLSRSESQQSDDMYHGQEGLSSEKLRSRRATSYGHGKCLAPQRVYNGDLEMDTDVDMAAQSGCQLPMSDGSASPCMPQMPCESPYELPVIDAGQKSSSDTSRDLGLLPKQSTPPSGIKLKIKMPKEVTLKEVPGTAKTLLSSGLLEGCRVRYQDRGGGVMLTGVVQNGGILCNCRVCKGQNIVNVSGFEKHAGSSARHPSDYIFLENGKSLHDILESGWQAAEGKFVEALRKAISSTAGDSEKGSCIRSGSGSGSGLAHCRKENCTNAFHPECVGVGSHHQRRSDPNSLRSVQTPTPQLSQTRDMSLHKMLFLPGGLPDGTEVAYYIKGQRILTGVKKAHGICCGCCNQVVSCSSFEAHAGWGSRRNPYNSIYVSDGLSLHEAALALAAQKQAEVPNNGSAPRDNEDFCAECGDGGNLILCDGCPGAYHTECAGLSSIPEGDWFCPLCQDQVGHEKRLLGKKSTRGSGKLYSTLTREQLLARCQRVVKASKNAIGGCVLCRNGDFLKSGFGAKTIMLCDQCEREYHVGCMKEKGVADLQELPAGEWFCSADCKRIHNILQALVLSGPESVNSSICSRVLEKQQQKAPQGQAKPHGRDFTWQLLHGRRGDPENGRILSEAAAIFTESFDPIIDASSGRDLISLMVYSRSIRDQDFGGMYCAVLKWNETVVSAAIIRVFGRQFAEMPLVATSSASRGQGYFQMLMSSIERLLGVLQVEHLILPAAEGAEGIWTNKFGFSKLQDEQLQRFGSEVQMMVFQGSSMLLKVIPAQRAGRCFSNK